MKNVTKNNLEIIWEQLDDACGSIDNAMMNINSIGKIPQDIKDKANSIDFSAIVSLKNEIEEILNKMKVEVDA